MHGLFRRLRRLPLLWGAAGCASGGDGPAVPDSCPAGEIRDAGECVPEACGTGEWGGKVGDVYVDGGSAEASEEAGDGSAEGPFASIQEGVDSAGDVGGGVVVVAGGTYLENIAMNHQHDGVELVGRCQEMVTIDGSGAELPGIAVEKGGTAVAIAGVTVTGGLIGLDVSGATVSVEGSSFVGNMDVGVEGSAYCGLMLADVRVADTQPVNGAYGRGISVDTGAALTAERVVVSGNRASGVFAASIGTIVTLKDSQVHDTRGSNDGSSGIGINVLVGAMLSTERVTVSASAGIGVAASGTGTSVTLIDSQVIGGNEQDGSAGGIVVLSGATLLADRVSVSDAPSVGLLASDEGTDVSLIESTVRNTRPLRAGTFGRGIDASGGATVRAKRVVVSGNTDVGIVASGEGTSLSLADSVVRDTRQTREGTFGRGLQVQYGASLRGERTVVSGNVEVGVNAVHDGTTVTLADSVVRDTRPSQNGPGGYGIAVRSGANVYAERLDVSENGEVGLLASDAGSRVTLVDSRVQRTRRGAGSTHALGVVSQTGASLDLQRTDVSSNEGVGVYAAKLGAVSCEDCAVADNQYAGVLASHATVALVRSTVTDTRPDVDVGGGIGLFANASSGAASLLVSDTTIGPHRYAAVWLDGNGTYDFHDNDIAGGASVADRIWSHGNSVFALHGVTPWDGSTGLNLVRNSFHGAEEVAVFLDASSATLLDNIWEGNAMDLVQQHCEGDVSEIADALIPGLTTARVCEGGAWLYDTSLQFNGLYLKEVEVLDE